MTLLGYELKKLLRLPALWVFLALCLALNITLIISSDYGMPFFNETSQITRRFGQRYNADYINALNELPQSENRDILMESLGSFEDSFDSYDTAALSRHYEEMVKDSPAAVRWMQKKYDKVALRVSELSASDVALDIYAGPMTQTTHQFLFGTLLRAVSAESCILAVLSMLYLLGFERQTHTELAVCTTKRGRKLWKTKTAAGIIAGLGLFLLTAIVTLTVYLSIWDYSGIWSGNVSSGFNYIEDIFLVKPFITWGDFSVAGYLLASLGMIGVMTVLSSLFAAVFGTWIKNTYLGAIALLLTCALGIVLPVFFSDCKLWAAYEVVNLNPATLWLAQNVWFTEAGLSSILPWQEVIAAVLWLAILLAAAEISRRQFYRKDIA